MVRGWSKRYGSDRSVASDEIRERTPRISTITPAPYRSSSWKTNDDGYNTMGTSLWGWRRNFSRKEEDDTIVQPPAAGSVAEALLSLLGDEELSDVRLRGSDGGIIMGVKAILASRSPVFRSRFFEPSTKENSEKITVSKKESSGKITVDAISGKETVTFDKYDCRILFLIVEFCYTDEVSITRMPPTDEITRLIANVSQASKAFALPSLSDKVTQWCNKHLNRYPALACAMIDEGMKLDDIHEVALQVLQIKAKNVLLPVQKSVGSGVMALSKPSLMFILRVLEDKTSHLLLFHAIQRWVEFSTAGYLGSVDPAVVKSSKEAFAKKLAIRFIKLSKIHPRNMNEIVNSGLFQKDRKSVV